MSLPNLRIVEKEGDLAAAIRAALRLEFSQLIIVAPVGHQVLGLAACTVADCRDGAVTRDGLCRGHLQQWRKANRPDIEAWIAAGLDPLQPRRILGRCAVAQCRRGQGARKLCNGHFQRWKRAGEPELTEWIQLQGPIVRPALVLCALGDCELEAETRNRPLCRNHDHRWRMAGEPPIEQFVDDCDSLGADVFDLRSLPGQLALEVQYGLQCRVDDGRIKTQPRRLMPLIRFLTEADVQSLRDHTLEEWASLIPEGRGLGFATTAIAFVRDCLEWFDRLQGNRGWDTEYPKDIWKLKALGFPAIRTATLRFDRIQPDWIRDLAKRWCRWRLSTGSSEGAVASNLYAVTRFSLFLDETGRRVEHPSLLNREVIESYLAWLAINYPDPNSRRKDLGGFASFLRTLQQHRWAPDLSPGAMIFNEDYPDMPEPKARALSEFVAAQLELESNLARFEEPRFRVLTEILQRTGLRVGDARQIAIDCLDRDQHGAPYLRYHNHKMKRDARTPIDDALAAAIAEHQRRVKEQYPSGTVLFPMIVNNLHGTRPISRTAYVIKLNAWVADCQIRTEAGDLAHVHPHQFRHTYATRLINTGVPQHVVKKLLDHDSDTMTAHYARLSMETVREEWSQATKVNIAGEQIHEGEGELADAIWLKNSLSRAKMALPNGFCTLPLQQTCEYANACLTCPMFLTTAEFLPQHRTQLIETQTLVASARSRGQERLAEMNKKVERNLLNIIGSLEAPDSGCCNPGNPCSADRQHPESSTADDAHR